MGPSILSGPALKRRKQLAFGELEPFTSSFLTVFLALVLAGITSEKTSLFELRTQLSIELDERPGDSETDRVCLTGNSTAMGKNHHVEFIAHLSDEKSLPHRNLKSLGRKILIERAAVHGDVAFTRPQKYTGDRRLAPAGPEVLLNLRCWHFLQYLSLFLRFQASRLRRGRLALHLSCYRLLSGMRMLVACVDFQLPVHLLAELGLG